MTFIKQLWKTWQWGIGKTILATVAAHGHSISVGLCQGFSAVLLPQLMEDDAELKVTTNEASWIAALGVISNPVGALLAGILMEIFGRKATIKIATFPYIIGWILIALSDGIVKLYVGRFISGLAVGMATASYVYVAEISPSEHRGILSAMGPIHVSMGVLFVYILGFICPWQRVAGICTLFAVVSFLIMCSVPESPAWLVTKGRIQEASSALMWLRSNPNLVDIELKELQLTVKKKTTKHAMMLQNVYGQQKDTKSISERLQKIRSPSLWKPFVILTLFFAFQEGSGIYVILYYAVTLFQEVGTGLNEYVASIVVALMRLFMSIVGALLIKNYSRKTLSVVSGAGMAISMAICGTYEHLYSGTQHSDRPMAWIPLVCVFMHVCVSMIGFLQIPWVMTGELFPLKVRGIMGGIVSSIAHLLIFTSVKTFPNLLSSLGMDYTLWMFGGAAFTGAIYCALFLPETRGRTLREIEMSFYKNHSDKKMCSGNTVDSDIGKVININVILVDMSQLENKLKLKAENKSIEELSKQSASLYKTLDARAA